ncbi:MAG: arginine--tRNA ligase [Gammaproteobacteria bacterium]
MNNNIKILIARAMDQLGCDKDNIDIEVNRTSDSAHGDFYTNVAMKLAKILKKKPTIIAQDILNAIESDETIEKIEVASPGYINFFLSNQNKYQVINEILDEKDIYTKQIEKSKKVHVEYVSANPTGPLHVGHGRGMILGEITAKFLSLQGHEVRREYYVNDAGRQIDLLLVSVFLQHIEKSGHIFIDEKNNKDGRLFTYKGNYINDISISLKDKLNLFKKKDILKLLEKPIDSLISYLKDHPSYFETRCALVEEIINKYIKKDLSAVNIVFDSWFFESQLYKTGLLEEVLSIINDKDLSYKKDGALWFKNSNFGEEKDRVLIKNNGDMTYFATDIAYHIHKFKKNDLLVDIWGADHHDYAVRLQTALSALGFDVKNRLEIHLVQFANLLKSGESISMSTRSGTFLPIQDLVRDIGEDATKFFYLTKKKDQHLEFDIDEARERNKNNPIYYIQYAHARITKILGDFDEKKSLKEDFNQLNEKNELNILKLINKYHETFNKAIEEVRPDLITNYLYQLSKSFHSYYADTKILTSIVKMERIKLIRCIDKIIINGLSTLDIKPMDSM